MNSNSTDLKEVRRFGLVALVLFGVLCGAGFWRESLVAVMCFGFLSATGACLAMWPAYLRSVYRGWTKIAYAISKTTTYIALAACYFAIITPAALIKRVLGGRPLPMKPDKESPSYWVTRSETLQPRERYFKRY
jgi:hypothetical protein